MAGPGNLGRAAKGADSAADIRRLSLDVAQIVADIAGLVDPTPISDGAGAILSVVRGDWLGAGLSVASMVPYVGDLAKAGKLPRYLKTVETAIEVARKSADARRVLAPIMKRLEGALDMLPKDAGDQINRLRRLVKQFLTETPGRVAGRVGKHLPDISSSFKFDTFMKPNGTMVREASGRLGVPGKVATHRSKSAQKAVSEGMGDDAGHLIGNRFGAPGGQQNLTLQHYRSNRNGTFKQLENAWARKLKEGTGIEVRVSDHIKPPETRPFMRKAEWTEIAPDGRRTQHEMIFMNAHSPRSRAAQGIEPTVPEDHPGAIIYDFATGQRMN
ncbi:MAG: DNA/RNA non-specific endonuclease [Planctomycetota bacterium]